MKRSKQTNPASLILLTLLIALGARVDASIIRVSPTGNDAHSGSTWGGAKATIQAAINAAVAGDTVWVKTGTYLLSKQITVQNKVNVFGGFAGTETDFSQRNLPLNPTILDGNGVTRAVYVPAGTSINTILAGLIIRNGSSKDGAGMFCDGAVTFLDGQFIGNMATNAGGAVNLAAASAFIGNTIFTANAAKNGGAIYVSGSPSLTLSGAVIYSNFASQSGAGVFSNASTLNVPASKVFLNTAKRDGAGLYLSNLSHATITDGVISENVAGRHGGGIACFVNSTVSFNNGGIELNAAHLGGGGLNVDSGSATITAGTFKWNTTGGEGGAVNAENNAAISLRDCRITGNRAGDYGGGVRLNFSAESSIVGCDILYNSAGGHTKGGGIANFSGGGASTGALIANNIIAFNSSGILDGSSLHAPTLLTNDVFGNDFNGYDGLAPGATDISADPLFVDALPGDYHLATISPCIDTGSDSVVGPSEEDLDGDSRIYGTHVDIGAFEWVPTPYPDLVSLTAPAIITAGFPTDCTVTLTGPAFDGGALLTLGSTDQAIAGTPATLKMAAGDTQATFTITPPATVPVAGKTATVRATYRGITRTLKVTVMPLMASLTFDPNPVQGGVDSTGTLTLNAPAPAGGVTINLASGSPLASPPASVFIAGGATSQTFTVNTTAVASGTGAFITATYGLQSIITKLLLYPVPALQSIAVSPVTVTGGTSATATATLKVAAPPGGVVVTLASNNAAATAPASISIAAGSKTGSAQITTSAVVTNQKATITATLNATTKTTTLTVTP